MSTDYIEQMDTSISQENYREKKKIHFIEKAFFKDNFTYDFEIMV